MYENNLFIKDGIIYYTTYGSSKKYQCENSIWLFYVFTYTYILIIDRCINAPGYGVIEIDGING